MNTSNNCLYNIWQNETHPAGTLVGIWNWEQDHEDLGIVVKDFWKKSKRKHHLPVRIVHVLVSGKIEALSPQDVFEPGLSTPIIPF